MGFCSWQPDRFNVGWWLPTREGPIRASSVNPSAETPEVQTRSLYLCAQSTMICYGGAAECVFSQEKIPTREGY